MTAAESAAEMTATEAATHMTATEAPTHMAATEAAPHMAAATEAAPHMAAAASPAVSAATAAATTATTATARLKWQWRIWLGVGDARSKADGRNAKRIIRDNAQRSSDGCPRSQLLDSHDPPRRTPKAEIPNPIPNLVR